VDARRTKIVCTLGPASGGTGAIERLIRAGMDVARLNLSHGTRQEHARRIRDVRRLSGRLGATVAVLVDLAGPKYRVGKLTGGKVALEKGADVWLTAQDVEGDSGVLPVNPPTLARHARTGGTILLDDGALRLRIVSKRGTEINCRVIVGGTLMENRGVVIPGMRRIGPFVTDDLRDQVRFAAQQRPDFVAMSFVGTAADVRDVRKALDAAGCGAPIISKIERGEAVRNFDAILEASDGIMVARGDLGTDIALEKVPLVQRDIIHRCNRAGKPVITATQMLESMVGSARPTRAEVSDVANAIFDGTDATMLSAETAIGRHPVQSVRMMARIARQAERGLPYDEMLTERAGWMARRTEELISYDACHTAHYLGAAAIVAFTRSGSTAGRVSRYRPSVPVLALSPEEEVCRRAVLHWGVHPVEVAQPRYADELFVTACRVCRDLGLARTGDLVVITGGIPLGVAGSTNLLKVEEVV
jgi:pyruvate kinase